MARSSSINKTKRFRPLSNHLVVQGLTGKAYTIQFDCESFLHELLKHLTKTEPLILTPHLCLCYLPLSVLSESSVSPAVSLAASVIETKKLKTMRISEYMEWVKPRNRYADHVFKLVIGVEFHSQDDKLPVTMYFDDHVTYDHLAARYLSVWNDEGRDMNRLSLQLYKDAERQIMMQDGANMNMKNSSFLLCWLIELHCAETVVVNVLRKASFASVLFPINRLFIQYLDDVTVSRLVRCHRLMRDLVVNYHIRQTARLLSWEATADLPTLPDYLLVEHLEIVCSTYSLRKPSSSKFIQVAFGDANQYRVLAAPLFSLLSKHLTHLSFGDQYNQPLTITYLPGTLAHLTFGAHFNQCIAIGAIPASVTHLTFGYQFNQAIRVGVLPVSLTHLRLGDCYNHPITVGALPAGLTHLKLGRHYTQPLAVGALPAALTHLAFGDQYDQPIAADTLPKSLTHLTFGANFNQSMPAGVLPPSLTHLRFGGYFRQGIAADSLPASLTHLFFRQQYPYVISTDEHALPAALNVGFLDETASLQLDIDDWKE